MKTLCLLIGMFASIVSCRIYANDFVKKDLLMQLHSSGDSCILDAKEGKYYLNAEKIHIIPEGIFLNSDCFGPLALSNLMQDNEGMYTVGMYHYYRCNKCGRCYNSQPSRCGRCGGTSFTRIDNTEDQKML